MRLRKAFIATASAIELLGMNVTLAITCSEPRSADSKGVSVPTIML